MDNTFQKPSLSIVQQLELLSSRGLIISDKKFAAHHLEFISYYRFCGYAIPFEIKLIGGEKCYLVGTSFEQVFSRYLVDSTLRSITMNALEWIEIALRTVIINELSLKYGPHWYLNQALFTKDFKYEKLIKDIKEKTNYLEKVGSHKHNKSEQFIQHYFEKYASPELPPSWMIAEVLPFGTWSKIFSKLVDKEDQKNISSHFKINSVIAVSWFHSLTYLRNLCAHHCMLLRRNFIVTPKKANEYYQQLRSNHLFSAQAAIVKIILDVINPQNFFFEELYSAIFFCTPVELAHLGFEENWHRDPFWASRSKEKIEGLVMV